MNHTEFRRIVRPKVLDALLANPPPDNGIWVLHIGLTHDFKVNIVWDQGRGGPVTLPVGRVRTWQTVTVKDSTICPHYVAGILLRLAQAVVAWGRNQLRAEKNEVLQ